MPRHNGFRSYDYQRAAPSWPITAEQNPEYPIPDSQPRTSMLPLECAQLLTEGDDLQAETVAGTQEGGNEGKSADEKWNHGPGSIAQGSVPASALTA